MFRQFKYWTRSGSSDNWSYVYVYVNSNMVSSHWTYIRLQHFFFLRRLNVCFWVCKCTQAIESHKVNMILDVLMFKYIWIDEGHRCAKFHMKSYASYGIRYDTKEFLLMSETDKIWTLALVVKENNKIVYRERRTPTSEERYSTNNGYVDICYSMKPICISIQHTSICTSSIRC